MAIRSIEFAELIDNTPELLQRNGELYQGDTFDNYRLYKVVNDDGMVQFLRVTVTHNSYGDPEHVDEKIELVQAVEKTVTYWEPAR